MLVIIVVLLSEVFLVPFEVSQKDEAPSLVEADQTLYLLQDKIEF